MAKLKVYRNTSSSWKELLILSGDGGYSGVVIGVGKSKNYKAHPIGYYADSWSGFVLAKDIGSITIKSKSNLFIDKFGGVVFKCLDNQYSRRFPYVIIYEDGIEAGKDVSSGIRPLKKLQMKFSDPLS